MRRALLPASVLVLLLTSCDQGAYPADIFPEMHHQPSYARLEPQRPAVPEDAVPVSGGGPDYTFDRAASLTNPVPRSAQETAQAQGLYHINCAMCHGDGGHGDGRIAAYFKAAGRTPPPDYASSRVASRTDGQLYWLVSHGIGGMPPFRDLLTDLQRWTLVDFIRQVQGA